MKNKMYFAAAALISLLIPGLSNSQTWTSSKLLPTNRDAAMSFTIGNYGFCGGGGEYQDDFWKYNPTTNTWKQLANIPGVNKGRGYAVGVSVGKYAYVGFGQDSASQTAVKRDWWRYDTATNTWTQKASLPSYSRDAAGSFVLNGKIYVFGGVDSAYQYLSDCWVYDTGADTWTSLSLLPDWIAFPSCFTINGKGYMTCYMSANSNTESAITYVFDPVGDTWTTKANFPGVARQAGSAFVINNIGYVGMGQSQYSVVYKDFYSYNPVTDIWTSVGNYGGSSKAWTSAFAIGNNGYVGSGSYFSGNFIVTTDDWWKFTPGSGLSVNEIKDADAFACYPVPAKDFITIENTSANNNENINYYIYNISGQFVGTGQLVYNNNKATLDVSGLSNGEYIVCLKNKDAVIGSKKITVIR